VSDARLREIERQAAADGSVEARSKLLVARLRAGTLVPGYTTAREMACPGPECRDGVPGRWTSVTFGFRPPCCNGTGRVPYDPWGMIRLMAYCGDEAARAVVGKPPDLRNGEAVHRWESWAAQDTHQPLAAWLNGLQHLAANLPPARWVEECPACGGSGQFCWNGMEVEESEECRNCGGTGQVAHDTPADRYLLVVAADAAGRAVHRIGEGHYGVSRSVYRWREAWRAFDACAAWLEEPSPERLREWLLANVGNLPQWIVASLSDTPSVIIALQAAARILTTARVREIAAAAVLEALCG